MDRFVLICDNIRSLHNVGSLFRTADGVGVDKIYLCGVTGRPEGVWEHKISKVALGAEKTVPWEYKKQTWRLIENLKDEGYEIVSLEITKNSIDYTKFNPKFPLALVVGNEVSGISNSVLARSDTTIEIPMKGNKESLNVSVAFGIAGSWVGRFK